MKAPTRRERRAAARAGIAGGGAITGNAGTDASTRVATTDPGRAGPSARRGSMVSPVFDWLAVGGLSMLIMVPLLLSGRTDLVLVGAGVQAWIAAAINMPHFLASYRLVYGSRAMMLEHKWASFGIPALLFAYIIAAIVLVDWTQTLGIGLVTIASVYLAWHYTGQVWGMMASFAWLAGTGFDATERRLIRTSLRILLAWHLAWFLYTQLRDPSRVEIVYQVASAATVVAFVLGAWGLLRMRRRTGVNPPLLAITAWLAIFVWYAVMARDPKALFWVQIAHAIQYLSFPVRVEFNRASGAGTVVHDPDHAVSGRVVMHMVVYAVLLLGISLLVAQVMPVALMGVIGSVFGEGPAYAAPILILMFINIHHYFTDGVLWKISNPAVRKDLFAHVART
ncbi:hypothetical protein [Gemmatimonas aurantiaca]|uniref:hypothetical protein n=1 Tax=Gemmatimonas aurantiaca TaxID=173480 RepID=UPI00301D1EDF